jgi:hypothetical protein
VHLEGLVLNAVEVDGPFFVAVFSAVDGETGFAEGEQAVVVLAEVSDEVVLVEGTAVDRHLHRAPIHYSI